MVEYSVRPEYSPRGDKGTLLTQIDNSADSVNDKNVKKAIVEAEDRVPSSLKIESHIVDGENLQNLQRRGSILNSTIANPIPRNLASYYISTSVRPVCVNLSTDNAAKIATVPGFTPAMAQKIEAEQQRRRAQGILRFSSYDQITALVGVSVSQLRTLEQQNFIKLFGTP
jgi:DNA uptake protein ComE-like DNA-binding protein